MAHMTNPLATAEQLYRWSSFSALPTDLQEAVFFSTQCLTQTAGILLELPQSTTAQANVLLARYWLVESPMANEFSDVSAACIYLVSKLGPVNRSPRDVANVYKYLRSEHSALFRPPDALANLANDPISYFQSDAQYQSFQQRMLALEARILYALSFDTHVALPHPLAATYLQTLDFLGREGKARTELARQTVAHLNTALLSPQLLYLTHQPSALATAAIYIAAREVEAKTPDCAWWEVFDVEREELGFLVVGMRSLEGWAKRQREMMPSFARGVMTRRAIEEEMGRREEEVDARGEGMERENSNVAMAIVEAASTS